MVPTGLHGLIKVVENWTFSLFFCFAELWGSVVIAVLFWTLANDVCTVDEAKTVYPMMGISANVALVAAGSYMKMVTGTVLQGASTQVFLRTMVATIVAVSVAMAAVRHPHNPTHQVDCCRRLSFVLSSPWLSGSKCCDSCWLPEIPAAHGSLCCVASCVCCCGAMPSNQKQRPPQRD